jgi:hypothetical protein
MNRPSRSTRTLRTCGSRVRAPIDVRQKRLGLSSARSYFSRAPVGAIPHGATARSTASRSRPRITSLNDLDHDAGLWPHGAVLAGGAVEIGERTGSVATAAAMSRKREVWSAPWQLMSWTRVSSL